MLDIKAKIEETVNKLKNDPKLMEEFKKDPVKAVESVIGIDLPDEQINAVITAVKGKIGLDALGGLFKK